MTRLVITKSHIKHRMLVSVITTVSLTGLYAYLYNLTFGLILTLTIVLLSFFSYFTVKRAAGGLRGRVSASSDIVSKGDIVYIYITLETDAAFFIPFLYVAVSQTPRFAALGDICVVVSARRGSPCEITASYRAVMWGGEGIGVDLLFVKDYMGLFEFEIACEGLYAGVFVRPELIESQNNSLAVYISNMVLNDDNDDITGDKPSIAAWPGYTHRPYAPPDSPNRINWKLYARLDKLMVRETEYVKNQSPAVILDPRGADNGNAAEIEERVIEGFLAHLISMMLMGLTCDVIITENDTSTVFAVTDYKDIEILSERLARYAFTKKTAVIYDYPAEGMPVIFTADPENAAAVYPNGIIASPARVSRDIWYIDEIYNITNIV